MLAGLLNSDAAVKASVQVVRVFVKLRETLAANKELAVKLAELERKIEGHDESIRTLFNAIKELMTVPDTPKKQIGFTAKEKRIKY